MTDLLSHSSPEKLLTEHLAEVRAIAGTVSCDHPWFCSESELCHLLDLILLSHDFGKASEGFQAYVRNPRSFRGRDLEKAHSPLSAALAVLWARDRGFSPLQILAGAQVVAGHHAGFRPISDLELALRAYDPALERQWRSLNVPGLSRLTPELADIGASYSGKFEDARRWLFRKERVVELLTGLELRDAIAYRMTTQFLFSVLLVADRGGLALKAEGVARHLGKRRFEVAPSLVDAYLTSCPHTQLNELRESTRQGVLARTDPAALTATLTLPTGAGKTLIAASWALSMRRILAQTNGGPPPRIVIALPFLSIIEQTERVWRELLGEAADSTAQTDLLMASHSISDRVLVTEGESIEQSRADFLLDTWSSEIIVTTFDQLLLSIFSRRPRHLMRFHNLMNALIILDEVQAIPCRLWDVIDAALTALATRGSSRILLMSATQPTMLSNTVELAGEEEDIRSLFAKLKRYVITLRHKSVTDFADFMEELADRADSWVVHGARVLITLNTRAAAKGVYGALLAKMSTTPAAIPIHLISADVTPLDRLIKIHEIRQGGPCLVVSTQTVEAGVDIDMDLVIRDFGPLDAIIQIAGRCNRNSAKGLYGGTVEIVRLCKAGHKPYCEMVYRDQVLLGVTSEVLSGLTTIREDEVLDLSSKYFNLLKQRKNLGKELTENFARWQEMEDIHEVLRGRKRREISFLVKCDGEAEALITELSSALKVADPWQRRSRLRGLAGAIQKRTVTVHAGDGFRPELFAEPMAQFWILDPRHYSTESGIDLGHDGVEHTCVF